MCGLGNLLVGVGLDVSGAAQIRSDVLATASFTMQ